MVGESASSGMMREFDARSDGSLMLDRPCDEEVLRGFRPSGRHLPSP